ncbi:MAG TPA: FAD:protein FMN transferase [Candidatus Dormibacteraeota bacterium]|nr:FAD:protein FMN transferase [Candidatus Dormibacteraeota bacterium]
MASVLGIADDRALGSSLRVIVTRPESLRAAKAAVDEVVAAIDAAASRFRPDSELSLLNGKPDLVVKVSPLLARAIAAAMRGAELSDGAVDPTVGSAVRLSGYDADFASIPPDGAELRIVAERIPGWRAVRFSESARTVVVPRGVELDLGATGKAFAADLAAEAAARAISGGGVLVSLGGDIAVAGEAPAGGWLIQASEDSTAPIAEGEETVAITSGGVATSGTTVRRWIRGGAVLHHIIDPATSRPVNSCWRTVTVVAATCVDANIASTAALVMGRAAIAWLESQSLSARLVDNEGVVRRVAGWPAKRNRS